MRVIFASDTPVIPEESRFQHGTAQDDYRFERHWRVPIKTTIEMEESDPPSDWAVVSKILTAVSWNMRISVGVGKTRKGHVGLDLHGYMDLFMGGGSHGHVKGLLHLFGKTIFDTTPLLQIKLGARNCIQFDCRYLNEVDDEDDAAADLLNDSNDLEELTENDVLTLVITTDNDVQITWVESFQIPVEDLISPCARILDTGYFADCHLVSNQDQDSPCHQVILKENCAKFEEEIASGNTKIKVDLSTHGVGALLRFFYCGTLDDAIRNWKLSLELLKVAHSLEICKLWDAIVDIFNEMEEPEMKTAVEVFKILVNSDKLETNKDLARKLVRIISKKSTEAVGDRAVLHKYTRDRAFFDAWNDFTSAC